MAKRATGLTGRRLVHEAARIMCEERLVDYRLAKQKAAQRLGMGPKAPMPSNGEIQAAVIEYQRLFGGRDYSRRLQQMRLTAIQAMQLLNQFRPRLVGAAATGAAHAGHRIQLHGFTDTPEQLDFFLHDRGIPFAIGERRYRFPDGAVEDVPMISFMAGEFGIDVAIFRETELRRAPLSPADGLAMKRLDIASVERLAAESASEAA
jgi:hypothetical protein